MRYLNYIVGLLFVAAWAPFAASAQEQSSGPSSRPATQATTRPVTLITIHAQSQPAREVFVEIARQAGAKFSADKSDFTPQTPRVTLDADKRPYWETVAEVCRQAKLGVSWSESPNTLTIAALRGDMLHIPAGPLLCQVGTVQLIEKIEFTDGERRTRQPVIEIVFHCEPGSAPVIAAEPLEMLEAVADNGTRLTAADLPPRPAWGLVEAPTRRGWATTIRLPAVPASVQRLNSIKFAATVVYQTGSQTMEFADLGKPQTREAGGWRIAIEKMETLSQDQGAIPISVLALPEGIKTRGVAYSATAYDAAGLQLICSVGSSPQGDVALFVRQTVTGRKRTGEPVKLIIEVPSQTAKVTVPLELKNIRLGGRAPQPLPQP